MIEHRKVTKAFRVEIHNLDVKEGDLIRVTRATAQGFSVHFGGMLHAVMSPEKLRDCSRVATPDEYIKILKQCTGCQKLEIQPGKWVVPPPCFTAREGVSLFESKCPECDK